ncbi:hypothetical protein HUT16_02615 [Kitasatospora sp. NA04385]|uniref:hypothetical protein n=1 Tax=Kitasatospora sp. NA04385 TaxID=2742135 RepID=UPI001590084B|nr:hypothetical protein [Kitasatospora sp. NA04385]QKW18102.1 hypothetical protein HUT16_02615 [Kitasatospora sp. NA04385]
MIAADPAGRPELAVELCWPQALLTDAEAARIADAWLAALDGLAAALPVAVAATVPAAVPAAVADRPQATADGPLLALPQARLDRLEAKLRSRRSR